MKGPGCLDPYRDPNTRRGQLGGVILILLVVGAAALSNYWLTRWIESAR